jgi:hypothetical protein
VHRFYRFLIVFTCAWGFTIPSSAFANTEDDTTETNSDFEAFILRPTVGLGVGNITFMGDIGNYHKGFHPTVSRLAYDLRVTNPLTEFLDISFYVMFGTMSSSERSLTRNLNFQSQIRSGGMVLSYSFANWLPRLRIIEPYIYTGIESFEFLSKTDLYDRYGNYYHYWSDGSIRNLAENDPNATSAVLIQRDYHYESDVRELNLDGFGKYPERSWAIPVGVGFNMHLNQRWKLRVGTSIHFTMTDLADGVTDNSAGDRQGDDRNDRYLFSSLSLNYDLQRLSKPKAKKEIEDPYIESEYLALDTVDTDLDGVMDFVDDCAYTPSGVQVNGRGCPFDKDKDKVPDFRDDELPTDAGKPVKDNGVAFTEQELEERYLRYSDTTGQYVEYVTISESETFIVGPNGQLISITPKKDLNYVIVIGTETKNVPANELHKYLHFKDFRTIESGDTVFYVVGNFSNETDAKKRIEELRQMGYNVEGIATTSGKGNDILVQIVLPKDSLNPTIVPVVTKDGIITYRVQIGAFKDKVAPSVFSDIPGLLVVKGEDGYTRYYSGSFKTPEEAAKHKVVMLSRGYPGSFLVAYRDGKRIPLDQAGVEFVTEEGKDSVNIGDGNIKAINPKDVKFRVQVGAFKSDVPTEIFDLFLEIGNIVPIRDENGMTKYYTLTFNSDAEAKAARDKIIRMGIGGAFIVGEYKERIISYEEALKLLK